MSDWKTQPMLIWSELHAAWWGPDEKGYTRHIDSAGRYTAEQAAKIVQNANDFQRNEIAMPDPTWKPPVDPLTKAAKAVVWWRYYQGSDAWDKLKEAIGDLEEIVGRPKSENEIY